MELEELYGRLNNFHVDLQKLQDSYKEFVEPIKPTRYSDHGVGYWGGQKSKSFIYIVIT